MNKADVDVAMSAKSYVRHNAVKRPSPCWGGWVWKGHWFSSRIGA